MIDRHDSAIQHLVRGVLWPGFLGQQLPEWLRTELESGLAGAVYFAQNLDASDPAQPAALSAEFRGANPLALIGIDEEGGNVTRLEAATGSTLPGAAQLGEADSLEATRAVGAELARRALAAGVSVVLAPTADVNTNPLNPVIGVRSFGSDAALVARHAAAMTEGIQSQAASADNANTPRIAACAKHYPGHGDTHLDSHLALPTAATGWQQLKAEHGAPFTATIDAGVKAIMTAHIRVEDQGDLPATLNPQILGELRASGFDGVIVTDALDMAAVAAEYGTGPGAVLALRAGSDLLCIGNPANPGNTGEAPDREVYFRVFDAILDALVSHELPLDRLREAHARVRSLAEWAQVSDAAAPALTDTPASSPLSPERASEIVRSGMTVHGIIPQFTGRIALIDLRARVTWAVATVSDALTAALNEFPTAEGSARPRAYRVKPTDMQNLSDFVTSIPAEDALVILVDRIASPGAQRDAAAELAGHAALRPAAVIVNVGLPSACMFAVPSIDARADSRISARVVAHLLSGD